MVSMEDWILRNTNPFDHLRSVNFWQRQKSLERTVESIHQEAMSAMAETLGQVARDHCTRTILLEGDSGSGKTYLLGRLKQTLNPKAFFVYIPPFPQSDYIWRHILRYTVNSLVQVPAGQKYSQLLLWLKGVLLAVRRHSLRHRIQDNILDLLQTDRQQFIRRMKQIYKQTGSNSIYNADQFFGILHDLTDTKLYPLACEWLRADDLNEASLNALGLKHSIETEQAAREVLANFGRIALNAQPIVLCFDQLESVARLHDGSLDLQTLFNVNTKIHDEDSNFLVIISLLTHTWEQYRARIDQSHCARIDSEIPLHLITLEQAEALWASRLHGFYQQAQPQPSSPIYPLDRHDLIESCSGGKTNPRDALRLGRDMFQAYKNWLIQETAAYQFKPIALPLSTSLSPPPTDTQAALRLRWQAELSRAKQGLTQIRQFTSLELTEMLKQVLLALPVAELSAPLLERTRFAGYSFSYRLQPNSERVGLIWIEDQGMDSFFRIMEACQHLLVQSQPPDRLCLIRAESLGKPHLKSHQLYRRIFAGPHCQVTPDLASVQQLAAYFSLVKDAREGDLVIDSQTLSLTALRSLVQQSNLFQDCLLLQALGVMTSSANSQEGNSEPSPAAHPPNYRSTRQVEDYLLSLVHIHPVIGLQTLTQTALSQFPHLETALIQERLDHLQRIQQVQVLNPTDLPEAQLVCRVRAV